MPYVISIDGPAGSGKSTLVEKLSKITGVKNIDTGMMYRAVAIYFLDKNIDYNDIEEVIIALKNIDIKLTEELSSADSLTKIPKVYLNNVDVSKRIREEIIGSLASKVSAIKEVRASMVERQRGFAKLENIIMNGRDIGSVVFPGADLKIFLTADIEARSERRYEDLLKDGKQISLEKIEEDMKIRDVADITKPISPLIKTEDMIEIDTTYNDADTVVNKVLELMKEKGLIK